MYDNEMLRFYTGFASSDVLNSFIDLIKPSSEKMKTWSQVQRSRTKNPGNGVADVKIFVNISKQTLAIEI